MLRKHIDISTFQSKKSELKLTYTCVQWMHLFLYFKLRLTALIPLDISNQKPLHFICGSFEHHEEVSLTFMEKFAH